VVHFLRCSERSIRINFTRVTGGLVAKGGELKTFVIAGEDGKFIPATARIDPQSGLR
jgi:sialate O-acetylesterase